MLSILPSICWAESHNATTPHEITMSAVDALKLIGNLLDNNKIDQADEILDNMPEFEPGPLSIELQFLRGRAAAARGDYDAAIKIYRDLLDRHPDLARVRFELAVCYMKTKQWRRADYQLRRAMAGNDLPEEVRRTMNMLRWVVRQNKNWNVWFNMGAAPDNNINTSAGGEECVNTVLGPLCRQLPEPVKAIGGNLSIGGNYEFRLSEHWRWKSDGVAATNVYNKHDFDDLYLSVGTGPRYVWQNGDIWLAGVATRRWYGWDAYNWSVGGKLDINYDFTRKLSGGISFRAMENHYDALGLILNGNTYGTTGRITYSFDASKYMNIRGGVDREIARDEMYTSWRPNLGVGLGMELPARFNIYLDASIYWQRYDGPRWVVRDGGFARIAEHSFMHRYAASLSNSHLAVWNFVPTITISYTRRDSNIWQREFDKWGVEFSMQQRF